MRLHFGVNDKFIQNFIDMTSSIGLLSDNKFVVYGNPEIAFTKSFDINQVRFVDQLDDYASEFERIREEVDFIYIHYLSDEVIDFLENRIQDKNVVWIFWGADGFSIPQIRKKLKRFDPFKFRTLIGKLHAYLTFNESPVITKKKSFIKRIKYFAHYLTEDFALFKPMLPGDATFVPFSYGVLDQIVKTVDVTGDAILIGNSASEFSNHLYVLDKLVPRNLKNQLILPMSYAGGQKYIGEVISFGTRKFPTTFEPLTRVLKFDEYIGVLAKSQYSIMYQTRSQAWGNIMQLLWQGSKVFMQKDNSLYQFLKRNNFVVFALDSKLKETDLVPITNEQISMNKVLLTQLFGAEASKNNYTQLLTLKKNL